MDDLLGEDWQAPPKPATQKSNTAAFNFTNIAPASSSLRSTPALTPSNDPSTPSISRPSSTAPIAASTGRNDQFGSLLSFKSQKPANNGSLSIQERQRQIEEERKRQQEQQAQLWNSLGGNNAQPAPVRAASSTPVTESEDDILAAFNRSAPVNKASHFPPPSSSENSRKSTPAQPAVPSIASNGFDDDDDTFGLKAVASRTNGRSARQQAPQSFDEDDILGDLGKPVSQQAIRRTPLPTPEVDHDDSSSEDEPRQAASGDPKVAELVDMGFPADTAAIALAENGGNVHNAVGWLLQQAHEEAKQKAHKAKGDGVQRTSSPHDFSESRQSRADRLAPAQRRVESHSPAAGDRDASQIAQDLGSKFLKGANSLWKASQKQMAKTMAEFQQDRDPAQPKWMQETSTTTSRTNAPSRQAVRSPMREVPANREDVTNEAALLDMPRDRPARSAPQQEPPRDRQRPIPDRTRHAQHEPSPVRQPQRETQQPVPFADRRPVTKLSRQEVEDQAAQAYISPARRKKAAPRPEPSAEPEVDFFATPAQNVVPSKATAPNVTASRPKSPSQPKVAPPKPQPTTPSRSIPTISPSAIAQATKHRKLGTEKYKVGDYVAAHQSYLTALQSIPATHPLTIIINCNLALTYTKTGDPKAAVTAADAALTTIGPNQGLNETIDLLEPGETPKPMRDSYTKALTRKADALEHLERFPDALEIWRTLVDANLNRANAIIGRNRCDDVVNPKPAAPSSAPKRQTGAAITSRARSSATQAPPLMTAANVVVDVDSAAAVQKLRAAAAAAERADDEKLALTDSVDARLAAWKSGKEGNLRALLQSLDGVLWEGAGWKKVGMADLIVPGKVKVVYVRAIGKVHPDKISKNATTEQRMVSASVFSTLNEAWDGFKKENRL